MGDIGRVLLSQRATHHGLCRKTNGFSLLHQSDFDEAVSFDLFPLLPYSPTPLLPSMERLSPQSIGQSIAHNQIRDERQQRQWAEAMLLLERLGLLGSDNCAVYLSNSAQEKHCTRWLETEVPWWIDRGAVRIDWRLCPGGEMGSQLLVDHDFADRLTACLMEVGVVADRLITVHWFNFCDPVLELPLGQLRSCLGAIGDRAQPVWFFDRQADWCVECWPVDGQRRGQMEVRWGDWAGADESLEA
jgi:hypothetical protein